jgi:glycyl-tRNA synthetase
MAEIEHYVDPKDKRHARFAEAKDIKLMLLPRDVQEKGETSVQEMTVGDAVAKVSSRIDSLIALCDL